MADDDTPSTLPEAGSLSATFRRFALRTTLVAGLMGVTGPGGTAQEGNKPKVAHIDKDASVSAPPLSVREKKRRSRINEALLEDARHHLDQLEAGSQTGYSNDLK